MKEEWGDLVVRNVDLVIWRQIQKMAEEQRPKVNYGPYLTEVMREHIERHKKT
jgi:uncharacterized protein YbcV (DUF1398 family)